MRLSRGLAFFLLALHAQQAAARVCDATGKEAPAVVTLQVSPKSPTAAIVVSPDCTVTEFLPSSPADLLVSDAGVQHVESVPSVEILTLTGNAITSGDFSSATSIWSLDLRGNKISSLDGFKFPKSLRSLYFDSNQLERILPSQIQDGPESLSLSDNRFTSISNVALPKSVTKLSLSKNSFSSLQFEVPSQLSSLDMSYNAVKSLEGVVWGNKLSDFACFSCQLTSISRVRFPANLKSLSFAYNEITTFEICQSDLQTMQAMAFPKLTTTQPKCKDTTATRVLLRSNAIPVCVISDDRFQKKYVLSVDPDTTTKPGINDSPTSTNSSSTTNDDSSRGQTDSPPSSPLEGTTDAPRANPPARQDPSGKLPQSRQELGMGAVGR